ncbi:hypothetical protein [Cereibacter johrii]|uniref:hypothetical protein n=1 Tax=Cereibacter johrii TaxID=445629 RepID=UPI002B2620E7|nr:hypothetical protein [Cereibacter johrii]
MLKIFSVGAIALSICAAPLHADVISGTAHALEPLSKTAWSITGPIILSDRKIIFANSASASLEATGQPVAADWSMSGRKQRAQVFRLKADPGLMERFDALCGGKPITHLAAWLDRNSLGAQVAIAVFSGEQPPVSIGDDGLCGTFNYEAPQAILATAKDDPARADPAAMPAPAASKGKWSVSKNVNPIDDSATVVLILQAESGAGKFGNPIRLYARCKSNTTEVYVRWENYLGDDSHDVYSDWKLVTSRIGDKPASVERWDISTDNEATFYPMSPIAFLKAMLDQDKLVLQTTPYGESPVTAVFDIRGLRSALGELAATCNWSF